MAKCQEKLNELQQVLLSWASSKKPKGPRPTKTNIKKRLQSILYAQHMSKVFTINLSETDGFLNLRYSVNRQALDKLTSSHLGRTLLITNRKKWSPPEVISCYRGLANIEEAFSTWRIEIIYTGNQPATGPTKKLRSILSIVYWRYYWPV